MRRYRAFQATLFGGYVALGVMQLSLGSANRQFGYGWLLIAACHAWQLKRGLALDNRLAAMRAQGRLAPAGGGAYAPRSDGPS